ncbi:hypothetical protein [Streptomyces celluloflavus]|uniref:Uncharacterized protein n=1 Tax=Streptomyces celluloflavus TaxID=58344 RepID=A0ABW7RKC2_9ACTN|nr:hypothetical protein OG717_33465 [Streptomyces celluloflavus]
MESEPWTIETIRDALGSPTLASRFIGEINRAPAHEVLAVFARWQGVAERALAAAERAEALAAADDRGEELSGVDRTDEVLAAAERIRARRGAA